MTKALIIDPFSGASGDMFLGALIDLGAPFDAVRETLLGIEELAAISIEREGVTRGVFAATRVNVTCPAETTHRSLSMIRGIIDNTGLADPVKRGAIDTFVRLAEAEAKVHGRDIEEIHFHEVGALDAIADIVGTHVALSYLDHPRCFVRTIALGSGTITGAHGEMPVPAPATIELLSGFPVRFTEAEEELVTPTGAALMATIAHPLSDGTLVIPKTVGYGAGSRDRKGLPNVLRVVSGSTDKDRGHVCIITSTLDDMNPEVYGYVMEQLFANGALEVYYNPVNMKKNRPGVEVTLITEEHNVYELANFLMANTTTIGVRIHREERLELERHREVVETPFGTIEVKVAKRPGGGRLVSPEFESCKKAAATSGGNLLDIYDAARKAWDKAHKD